MKKPSLFSKINYLGFDISDLKEENNSNKNKINSSRKRIELLEIDQMIS